MMLLGIGIVLCACAGMICLVFFKPSVQVAGHTVSIYWASPMLGAVALWAVGCISGRAVWQGLTADSEVNPLKILVLFLSMTLLSVFLDHAGFFRYLAAAVLRRSGNDQRKLFLYLYLTVSVLTVFTSNDIVVLTFTPFICYFAANAEIDPLPYLIGEFVAANSWSMALIIGNPTNIYLAASANVDFLSYIKVMLLPTALAGVASFGALWLLFRKKLKQPLKPAERKVKIVDKVPVILGVVHLAGCVIFLVLSSYLSLPMWLISLSFFVSLYLCGLLSVVIRRQKPTILTESLRRAPWEIIPFVLSMFVMVMAMDAVGVTEGIAAFLSGGNTLIRFGVSSFLTANVINNIPMSVLFSAIVSKIGEANRTAALFSAIVGSNLGAFFTPIGALAGIMWMGLLKNHGVRLSFGGFVKYGTAVAIPALAAALFGLRIIL